MKNLFNTLPKKLLAFIVTAIAVIGFGSVAVANFGPDRPTKVWTPQENGFQHVTFNSYTGVPNGIGDERDFLRGVVSGRDADWVDPVANVANNDTVTAKIYIHNDADPLLNDAPGNPGIARDVNVKIDIPTGLKADHEVKTTISASNAQPKSIFDTLDINSVNDSLFQLTFVPGSAKLGGQTLSDSIFTTGLNIGDQNGCFQYLREITFELEIEKPGYQIQKAARIKGEDSSQWRKVVNAERGDKIEWRISFQNIGSTVLEDVKLVDDLPSYTDVTPGSVELVNTNFPAGFAYGPEAIQDNGDQVNIDIGDYAPNSNAYVYLETTIQDNIDIQCGNHQIANVAYVTPAGLGTLNDNAKVNIINEDCVEPPVTTCVSLAGPVATLEFGGSTELTASSSTTGPTLEGYIFTVDDIVVQDSENNKYTFKGNETGSHAIKVTAKFSNGNKTSEACEKTITVEDEPIDPVYACDLLSVTFVKGRTYKFTVTTTAKNGATVKDYRYNFGDDAEVMLTDKNMVEHTYAKDGKYASSVDVTFNVNGETKVVSGEDCVKVLSFSDTVEKCDVLGKENLPKNDPSCRVLGVKKELPNTGAGSSIAGLFAAISVAGSLAHRRLTLRRNR